jgi:hypothetical protein
VTDSLGSTLGATAAFLVGRTVSNPSFLAGDICDRKFWCINNNICVTLYDLNSSNILDLILSAPGK